MIIATPEEEKELLRAFRNAPLFDKNGVPLPFGTFKMWINSPPSHNAQSLLFYLKRNE